VIAPSEEVLDTAEGLRSVNAVLHAIGPGMHSSLGGPAGLNGDSDPPRPTNGHPQVFLDGQLRLVRFNSEASALFGFHRADVGRRITDFNHTLGYPDLDAEIQTALLSDTPRKLEVRDSDGRAWLVTALPTARGNPGGTRVELSCVDVSNLCDVQRMQGLVDGLAGHVAVLDRQGVIRLVNRAWRDFAERNGDPGVRASGPGVNYLEVCRRSARSDEHALRVRQGLQEVLEGSRAAFTSVYPCHAPDEQRWFLMHASPWDGGMCMVTHLNLTSWVDPARMRMSLGGGR